MQITSSMQHALMMVHQYPRAAGYKMMLEVLVEQHKAPSTASLAEGSGVDDLQHAANWQMVVQYVESLDADSVRQYCPMSMAH